MSARSRIDRAFAATARMDGLLNPALDALLSALGPSNGAGIYRDVSRVRSAMAAAKAAIIAAEAIDRETQWPSNEDYDAC
jgi:hypothetical protein